MKKSIALLYGGKSPEHEVSVVSARNVYAAIDLDVYNPILIAISPDGDWYLDDDQQLLDETVSMVTPGDGHHPLTISPNQGLIHINTGEILDIDAVFSVLHGGAGEDGSIQGLLRVAKIPCVGPDVLGSAVCMDKDVTKRLLSQAGIRVAPGVVVYSSQPYNVDQIVQKFGLPLFVKPANAGSSVGVAKVKNMEDLKPAVDHALEFDVKVLVEQSIDGREIECAVLGNQNPQASICGEVMPVGHDFYSYESKYLDADGSDLAIPALDVDMQRLQDTAIKIYTTLECKGLSRVDMFWTSDGQIICNEVNTLPGFTSISMYPKLREASGLSYTDLISKLIELAIERHTNLSALSTTGS